MKLNYARPENCDLSLCACCSSLWRYHTDATDARRVDKSQGIPRDQRWTSRQTEHVRRFFHIRTQSFSILHRRHHTVMANTHISLKFIVRKTKILRQLYCHWIQYNYDPTKIIYNAFVFVCARACVLCVCWCALRKPFGGPMGGRRWPADCAPMLLCAA